MKLAVILLTAAAGLAACTQTAATGDHPGAAALASPMSLAPGACFRTRDIRNHTLGDDHTVYLNVNDRAVYRVEMRGACLSGATSSDPLVMREPPGAQIVCRPMDLDVSVSMGDIPRPCIVGAITAMRPEEVAALPSKLRP